MRRSIDTLLVCGLFLVPAISAAAQSPPNPAMTAPDQVAWQLFIQANTRAGGSNSTFETWASDTDLFQPNPQFPAVATPPSLRPPILPQVAREGVQQSGGLLPALPPGAAQGQMEETRHNKPTFDFIVQNNLYKRSGVKAAFGKALSFPVDSVEVKGNWLPVSDIPQFTNNKVTVAQVPQLYHVNSAAGVQYALVSMHVISKQVPNWTWATFEHRFNPGRCDIIGCRDNFGAQTAFVPSNRTAGQGYPDCVKTAALTALLSSADIDPVYNNYCLKGSQVDFVDNVGLDIRVGNSVTEDGFVATSSCITCHGRAAFKADGTPSSQAGFLSFGPNGPVAPLGPLLPEWYWKFSGQPPIFEGKPGLTRIATAADFVWSIPFCAYDDTQNPAQPSPCAGK
ncbi:MULTISPECIES: hypothetical protein [unclassified Bradyrhizobium]|uniref:hypothetical protein n=1 Tax=unclassified Bradyrhizobium TaxID=2631580 RepID=UPI001BA52F55|nr:MULTISPECIES: hypothetical protein [unclassified Bradyrhizobium]MBR1208623.1 hypothetical protein [Bradyrhizobium sp. AUGA SZCCT0124]MBR1314714.1 hypothetical protein [Bradyrhizobium sp. AUGA SZCCT0051]MBR1345366.1 hypothetical protein [Bradyrhizobium sp. AUGA SZCCT0105]MBR1359997.1 hypothetical protein [Bradyrhizobium sp. AUGA SZCCT0045]